MAKDKNGRHYHFSPFGFCDRYNDTDEKVPESAKKKDECNFRDLVNWG